MGVTSAMMASFHDVKKRLMCWNLSKVETKTGRIPSVRRAIGQRARLVDDGPVIRASGKKALIVFQGLDSVIFDSCGRTDIALSCARLLPFSTVPSQCASYRGPYKPIDYRWAYFI